jgi:hypothetical protein
LATKHGADGEKLKLWARLVANGQRQQYGLDYIETFTPTTNMTTIRIVLTIATHWDWEIHQVDIKSAYLNATLKDTIYMRAPPGYLKTEDFGKVLLLLRSLYGCKGTSVRFLTSPILAHSPPVHMYSLHSPLYHFQGLYL